MSRPARILAIIAAALAGLVIALLVGGLVVVQTQWFHDFVRGKIISAVEDGTGGKAEIGTFTLDWHHLRAQVRDFVLHGTEMPPAAPLFRANLLEVDLKLTSPFKGAIGIAGLLLDTPQANVIVYPDGNTNVPRPKTQSSSNKSGLQTVVDLAIGRFEFLNGTLSFAQRKSDFSASAGDLRVRLDYDPVHSSYVGEIDLNPLHLRSAQNAPLDVNVKLPLTIESDKVSLSNASLATPESLIRISASLDHLKSPRTSAHINAWLSLDEVRRSSGLATLLDTAHGPKQITADIEASADGNRIAVESAAIRLGQSEVVASGALKESNRPGRMRFSADLALGEIGRLLRISARPEGIVRIGGNASLDNAGNYRVQANVNGRSLAVGQGSARITGASLDSSMTVEPRRVELGLIRLTLLEGSLVGSGALDNMRTFQFSGNLNNFDIDTISRVVKPGGLGYAGVLSGNVQASGDVKNTSDLAARAALSIQPRPGGTPVSGRINADYNGRADLVNIAPSYISLPNTRLDLSGSLGQQIHLRLVTRNAADFKPVGAIPLTFQNGGNATVDAAISGKVSAPRIGAQIAVINFAVDGRPFTRFDAGLTASPSGAAITNARLTHGMLQAQVNASVGLRDWKPEDFEPLRADATIRDADLADILTLAGQSSFPAQGALTADAHIQGTVGDPRGDLSLAVMNGTLRGGHFDSLTTRVEMNQESIDLAALHWIAGPSRIDANAMYQHAPNDLKTGNLRVHVASNQIQLAQFQSLVKDRPGLRGTVSLNADAAATVRADSNGAGFQLTNLTANASARGVQMEGNTLGDATIVANTDGSAVQYTVNSNFAGSTIRISGQSLLTGDHETNANAQISNLSIDRMLAVAGRRDLAVKGTLGANAQVAGTLSAPRANAALTITGGSAFQQSFSRLQATINYTGQLVDLPEFQLDDGPNNIEISGSFMHPAGNFQAGEVQFSVRSNQLQLARLHAIEQAKPGLAGTMQLVADGAGTLRPNAPPLFSRLNANVAVKGLSVDRKPVGDATLVAETRGQQLALKLTSDFARSNIKGDGTLSLTGDYPVDARVNFSNVTYSGLENWIASPTGRPTFDASVDGRITINGSARRIDALGGSVELSKLEAHSTNTVTTGAKPRVQFELRNDGPVSVELARSIFTIRSAKFAGPFTSLSVTGSASIANNGNLNLQADGNVKLDLLEAFSPDISSSGSVSLNAAITGTTARPSVNGRLQLQDASFNMADLPNGVSSANGGIAFNGTEAVIQNITAQSGGGKITLSGSVGYGGPQRQFRVQARADQVHIRYPESITTTASADLSLTGASSSSLVSGTVRISEVAMHSHTDVGAILNSVAAPPSAPSVSSGFMAGMKFDVRIVTTTGVQFRTSLTENLQADARLTLRGNPDHPGMLGRVQVTQGQVVFFGNKYNVDQGTISFFDPNQIQPILDVALSTAVQGVSVTLTVSGPADKMKLSYNSDPPLQFSDIVSLLASGKPPTSDPVLAARQAQPPQQSVGQAGTSMLLGQAVASPVSGRLQRLFGVSKLKIDPQVTGANNNPSATLSLQQQVSNEITFTYIQDVTRSNPQIIRIEWAVNPRWSAILARDVNGEVNLDLFYKKRFH